MKFINNNLFKYILSVILIYISLFFAVNVFKENNDHYIVSNIEKRRIKKSGKDYNVLVYYPKFTNNEINNEILSYIYTYTSSFIDNFSKKRTLKINYEVYVNEYFLNIFFTIENSLNKTTIYKSFNYNISKSEETSSKIIKESMYEYINIKYDESVSNKIKELSIDDYSIKLTSNGIHYYFNYDLFNNIDFVPNIYIDWTGEVILEGNEKPYKVAFTFDDGPSEYTKEIVDVLLFNNSKATFFMLGNRMKYNQDIVNYVYENGMEIGSHSYSHKNLNNISDEEIETEINSTTIIYKEITGSDIKLFRPPYGNIKNNIIKDIPFSIIKWNIDTLDWLYRDEEKTYNYIINNVKDGAVILLHDIYPETLKAIKKVIPKLNQMGYQVTSISDLAEKKNISLVQGVIYTSFDNYNLPF